MRDSTIENNVFVIEYFLLMNPFIYLLIINWYTWIPRNTCLFPLRNIKRNELINIIKFICVNSHTDILQKYLYSNLTFVEIHVYSHWQTSTKRMSLFVCIHLLRLGWRNFFPVVLLCQFFWFLVGNKFWCYLLTYLEYNRVVALC